MCSSDLDGDVIASQTEAIAIGVVPNEIGEGQEGNLAAILAVMTGIPANIIRDSIYSGGGAYVPIGEVSLQTYEARASYLNSFTGVAINPYTSRYYFNGGVSPQVIGYLLSISPEQYEEFRRKGYAGDEKIGAAGIEKWGEEYLRGRPAADLYVVNADGTYDTAVGKSEAEPAYNIYTTIDKDFQILDRKSHV